jgi:hypothetical protein
MRTISFLFTLLIFGFQINAQTYIPFLQKNGYYIYLDSATKKNSNITGEMNSGELFTKNGNAIIWDKSSGDTRIINKNGKDLFITRVGSREQWTDKVVYYRPLIIFDESTDDEYIVSDTYDRSKRSPFEQYPGYRIFNNGSFSNYFRFKSYSDHSDEIFSEGLAIAENPIKNKKGFINKFGNIVIPEVFEYARPFRESRAAVYSEDYRLWGFIDINGEIVVPLKYKDVSDFRFGVALVTPNNDNRKYFIDKNGNKIMDFEGNDYSIYFSDSLIENSISNSPLRKFYDNKGKLKLITPYKTSGFVNSYYTGTLGFNNGTLLVEDSRRSLGLIDKKGKIIVNFGKYTYISAFKEGLASVKTNSGLWGFIDNKGNEIIKPTYYECQGFSDGLAAVKKINGWFFINKIGEVIIGPINFEYCEGKYIFNKINGFKNGIAFLSNSESRTYKLYFDKSGFFYVED